MLEVAHRYLNLDQYHKITNKMGIRKGSRYAYHYILPRHSSVIMNNYELFTDSKWMINEAINRIASLLWFISNTRAPFY